MIASSFQARGRPARVDYGAATLLQEDFTVRCFSRGTLFGLTLPRWPRRPAAGSDNDDLDDRDVYRRDRAERGAARQSGTCRPAATAMTTVLTMA